MQKWTKEKIKKEILAINKVGPINYRFVKKKNYALLGAAKNFLPFFEIKKSQDHFLILLTLT